MPTLSRARAGYRGEGMATHNATALVDGGLGPAMGARNLRMRDGTVENTPNGPIRIHKIMITHSSLSDNYFELWDINGRLFKMFLHQTDFREAPGILNRRPPPTFLVPPLRSTFTTQTEIIDIPEPGLYAEGNIGVVAQVNDTTDTTIYYTYAQHTAEPTP
mgnify:CR=1 FL=1